MSSAQNNDQINSAGAGVEEAAYSLSALNQRQQQKQRQHMQYKKQHEIQGFQTYPNIPKQSFGCEIAPAQDRKLYAIEEQQEAEHENAGAEGESVDNAYDADVDDDMPMRSTAAPSMTAPVRSGEGDGATEKIQDDKMHIYELFQPWALKTYGDLAKTKTITMRKKVRILKALEGKEHSRPDSSKFRFWVKTKGFTTKRPESFEDAPCTQRHKKPLPPNAVLSDNPADVDLYVASTTKDLEKRTYRKVAVVEEFFDIIFQIHMELGGRSGMHAGQKRTYRIISETYAFLPREAVTRFLSICPECKKNLRPSSPTASNVKEDLTAVIQNESSSEIEVLNYSSHTESSLEAGPTAKASKKTSHLSAGTGALHHSVQVQPKKRRYSNPDNNSKAFVCPAEQVDPNQCLPRRNSSPLIDPSTKHLPMTQSHTPKIRVNPNLQRPFTPPIPETSAFAPSYPNYGFDFHSLKSQDNLMRYYDFMRRLYSGNSPMPHASSIPPPSFHKELMTNENKPRTKKLASVIKTPTAQILEAVNSSSSDEDTDNTSVITAKRFKSSFESSDKTKALDSLSTQLQIPSVDRDFIQSTQIRAINLSKNSSHFSSQGKAPVDDFTPARKLPLEPQLTSTPTAVKQESLTPPKSSTLSTLRIPQLRSITGLPPLDFERLKPITSTYLQLTRSMGLSDEEALRFDNLQIHLLFCRRFRL